MKSLSIKAPVARVLMLAAALLVAAGPAAPLALACGGDGEAEPLLVNGELPGGG